MAPLLSELPLADRLERMRAQYEALGAYSLDLLSEVAATFPATDGKTRALNRFLDLNRWSEWAVGSLEEITTALGSPPAHEREVASGSK